MHILSLGLGVQSTAMYYMSSMGMFGVTRCDYAIFVDTGREKKGTLAYLKYLKQWQKANKGIPIIVVRKKNLYKDLLNSTNSTGQRFSPIPAFTHNEDGTIGMLRRQCTNEYKIEQVDKEIRSLLKVNRTTTKVYVYKGISLDEIDRLSIPQTKWKIHMYPFCGYMVSKEGAVKMETHRMTRNDIINWFNLNGLPVPPKSSCTFCPYQSDAAWYDMKKNHPSDFKSAVLVDRAIRDSTEKGTKSKVYLHKSCMPLEDIEFSPGLPDLWHGECSGGCHT